MTPIASIQIAPPAPTWVITVLVAALLSLAWRSTRAPISGPLAARASLGLRCVAVASLSLLMLGIHDAPPTPATPPTPEKPRLTVLLDASASMLVCDTGDTPRLDRVRRDWLNAANLADADTRFDLDCRTFDATLHAPTPISPFPLADKRIINASRDSQRTRLVASLLRAVNEAPADSGLLLVSDGHDNDENPPGDLRSVAALALARGVTIHTLSVGDERPTPALLLSAQAAQRSLRPGQTGQVHALVRSVGIEPGAAIQLMLEAPEVPATRHTFRVADGGGTLAIIPFTPSIDTPPARCVPLRLTATVGERSASCDVVVQVEPRRERVVYVEGDPSFESSLLARSLRDDPRLSTLTIIAVKPGTPADVATNDESRVAVVPRTAREWAEFDAVILGRRVEAALGDSALSQLAASMRMARRPQVVFARGDPCSSDAPSVLRDALNRAAGVRWPPSEQPAGASRPSLTASARQRPALRAWSLVPDARARALTLDNPASEILVTAGDRPLLAASPDAVVVTDGAVWLTPLTVGRPLDSLARDLAHWAISRRDDPAELRVQADSPASLDRPFVVEITSAGALASEPTLTVVSPRQTAAAIPAAKFDDTRWSATFTPMEPGLHELRVKAVADSGRQLDATALVAVAMDRAERVSAEARPASLRALAHDTQGVALEPAQADRWPAILAEQAHATRQPMLDASKTIDAPRVRPPGPTWIDGGLIALLIVTLAGEWFVRRAAFPDRS